MKTSLAIVSNITLKPIITERSLKEAALNKYTFEVPLWADKKLIKSAAEKIFEVEIEGIRTAIYKGRPRKIVGTRLEKKSKRWKKTILIVKEGQKIDLFESKENKNK